MFDFGNAKQYVNEEDTKASDKKIDINSLLENIDFGNMDYYESLSESEKKGFQPYVVQRWVSALDDSIQVTYSSKRVEEIFGKWTSGGKEALSELKIEFNNNNIKCISVAKYEHSKYDWRIKFSVQSKEDGNKLIEAMKEFGITGSEITSLIDSTTYKYHLIMLNDMVNDGMWDTQSHPELVYQLLCSVSKMTGEYKKTHSWLAFAKGIKNVDQKLYQIMKTTVDPYSSTQLNEVEYKILLTSYTVSEFDKLLMDYGYQDSDRKPLIKSFKTECAKYGKNV